MENQPAQIARPRPQAPDQGNLNPESGRDCASSAERRRGSPSVDEGEEHDRWFARGEAVRRSWLHVQPEARPRVELLAINGEIEPTAGDLHNCRARGLMLAQPRTCVEAKDRDLGALVVEDHAGDNRPALNVNRGSEVRMDEA